MRSLLLILLSLVGFNAFCQNTLGALERIKSFQLEPYLKDTGNVHTSLRPYVSSQFKTGFNVNYGFSSPLHKITTAFDPKEKPWKIVPIMVGEVGFGEGNGPITVLGGGLGVEGEIGKKLDYSSSILVGNYDLLSVLDTAGVNFGGYPGYGVKEVDSAKTVLQDFSFVLEFDAGKFIDLRLGKGKHFIGEGYRSLLLSDNAPTYPFLELRTQFWDVQYSSIFSQHKVKYNGEDFKKYAASHYLSWNVLPKWNIGVFESVIWQSSDTLLNRGFDIAYLNPFIYYRPVEYNLGSSDNSLIGFSSYMETGENSKVYGQFILDEFLLSELRAGNNWWGNKYGGQIGWKCREPFGVEGTAFLIEYNFVRPYTFSHLTSGQNYGHQGHSLTHPLGSNFSEFLMEIRRIKHGVFTVWKLSMYKHGRDTSQVSYGGDIFASYGNRPSEYGHEIGQGALYNNLFSEFTLGVNAIGIGNLNAFIRHSAYIGLSGSQLKDPVNFFQIGISSQLYNSYRAY